MHRGTEDALLPALRAGDEAAFAIVVDGLHGRLLAVAKTFTASSALSAKPSIRLPRRAERIRPQVRLRPANAEMDPIYVSARDLRVQGKVVSVMRSVE